MSAQSDYIASTEIRLKMPYSPIVLSWGSDHFYLPFPYDGRFPQIRCDLGESPIVGVRQIKMI